MVVLRNPSSHSFPHWKDEHPVMGQPTEWCTSSLLPLSDLLSSRLWNGSVGSFLRDMSSTRNLATRRPRATSFPWLPLPLLSFRYTIWAVTTDLLFFLHALILIVDFNKKASWNDMRWDLQTGCCLEMWNALPQDQKHHPKRLASRIAASHCWCLLLEVKGCHESWVCMMLQLLKTTMLLHG